MRDLLDCQNSLSTTVYIGPSAIKDPCNDMSAIRSLALWYALAKDGVQGLARHQLAQTNCSAYTPFSRNPSSRF